MDHRSRGSCWGKVGNVLCFPSFPQPFPTLRDPSPDCGEYVVPGWSGPTHYKAGIPLFSTGFSTGFYGSRSPPCASSAVTVDLRAKAESIAAPAISVDLWRLFLRTRVNRRKPAIALQFRFVQLSPHFERVSCGRNFIPPISPPEDKGTSDPDRSELSCDEMDESHSNMIFTEGSLGPCLIPSPPSQSRSRGIFDDSTVEGHTFLRLHVLTLPSFDFLEVTRHHANTGANITRVVTLR